MPLTDDEIDGLCERLSCGTLTPQDVNVVVELDATQIEPQVTWGTSHELVLPGGGRVPDAGGEADGVKRGAIERALAYMGLRADQPITDIAIDKVFIGSCTNSRIEDLRAAASVARGRRVAGNVRLAMVVPGSGSVKTQAESEGLELFAGPGEGELTLVTDLVAGAAKAR